MRSTAVQLAAALAGGMAIIGHNWSMFNGFKGGAGGITSAATAMAISPLVGGMVWLIGGILIWWTRIASVGSFAVGVSAFAIFLLLGVNRLSPWPYIIFGVIAFFSVLVALRNNRERFGRRRPRDHALVAVPRRILPYETAEPFFRPFRSWTAIATLVSKGGNTPAVRLSRDQRGNSHTYELLGRTGTRPARAPGLQIVGLLPPGCTYRPDWWV